jgi:hypothetical protein
MAASSDETQDLKSMGTKDLILVISDDRVYEGVVLTFIFSFMQSRCT